MVRVDHQHHHGSIVPLRNHISTGRKIVVVSLPDGAFPVALDIGVECMSGAAVRPTGSVNSCRGLVHHAGLSSPCAAAVPPRLFSNASEVPFMFGSIEK